MSDRLQELLKQHHVLTLQIVYRMTEAGYHVDEICKTLDVSRQELAELGREAYDRASARCL